MRRVYAIILLIPVLAMFAGVVTAASYCARVAGSDCGAMGKMQDQCMTAASPRGCQGRADGCGQCCPQGRQDNHQGPQGKQQGQQGKHQGQKGKSEQKGKDAGGCCIDCPLCSVVTFKSFFRLEVAWQVTIIDYTVMPNNNLSDYFQQHWKPPGVSLIS
jgi:hypothetical protein